MYNGAFLKSLSIHPCVRSFVRRRPACLHSYHSIFCNTLTILPRSAIDFLRKKEIWFQTVCKGNQQTICTGRQEVSGKVNLNYNCYYAVLRIAGR